MPHGWTVWGALLVTGVFASALAFLVQTWAQRRTSANRTALVFTLEPVWAALFGFTLAGDRLGALGWAGCAVIMAGIVLAEPAAADVLARLVRRPAPGMTAVVLALASAAFFGAMTVAIRLGLRGGDAAAGTLATLLPAVAVALVAAAPRHDMHRAWPFFLAGLLAPGCSQILFTLVDPRGRRRRAPRSRSRRRRSSPSRSRSSSSTSRVELPLVLGALAIVGGAVALAGERDRPEHLRSPGSSSRSARRCCFAVRDNLVRALHATRARRRPRPRRSLAGIARGARLRASRCRAAASCARFAPAGLFFGLSYVCLFEAYFHGPVSVVSPLVATECLWGVGLSALVLGASEGSA